MYGCPAQRQVSQYKTGKASLSAQATLGCSKVGAMMGHGRDWCGYLSVIEPDRALFGVFPTGKKLDHVRLES